jgi:hypothetical protein
MMTALRWRTAAILGALLLGCGQSGAVDDAGGGPESGSGPTAAQGLAAARSRQCDRCHQSPDPSDGVLSGQTTPVQGREYGSNLTPDPDTGMDAWDAGSIATAVLQAVDNQGGPLCASMPRFADAGMGPDEALAIATYLQTLSPVRHVIPASMCPERSRGDAAP